MFGRYEKTFQDNGLDGQVLPFLSEEGLKEWKVDTITSKFLLSLREQVLDHEFKGFEHGEEKCLLCNSNKAVLHSVPCKCTKVCFACADVLEDKKSISKVFGSNKLTGLCLVCREKVEVYA
jgi:hypothetical protein